MLPRKFTYLIGKPNELIKWFALTKNYLTLASNVSIFAYILSTIHRKLWISFPEKAKLPISMPFSIKLQCKIIDCFWVL